MSKIATKSSGIRSGVWQGEIGSCFRLSIDGNQVSGTFQTIHGSPDHSEVFPVTGFTDGEFIGFVVLWKGHSSVTSWAGRLCVDDKGEHIRSNWNLVRKYLDKDKTQETEFWDCNISNISQLYYVSDE